MSALVQLTNILVNSIFTMPKQYHNNNKYKMEKTEGSKKMKHPSLAIE